MEWRPFDLHPEYPPEGIAVEDLERRYGGEAWRARLRAMFSEAGLPYDESRIRVPNTRTALRLSELARERGVHRELHDRLMTGMWSRALDLGDHDVLRAEADAVGLDGAEVDEVLATDAYLDVVLGETNRLLEHGGTGVPAWAIDGRVLVPGAQPHEVFDRVLERLGHRPSAS